MIARHWLLPLVRRATAVLHATDPVFDPPPPSLPQNHRYVGPLDLAPPPIAGGVTFLHEPENPCLLVTPSTLPQTGELAIACDNLAALADRPVSVLVTLGHVSA